MATSDVHPDHVPPLGQDKLPASYFTWPGVLDRMARHEELSESQVAWAMEQIMRGDATDAQVAAFAYGIRVKGITAAELSSAASTMTSFATPVDFSDIPAAVDIVGTGGDGHHTVNVSTMASFVVAATGTTVVKHGNRAASSLCGGADVLEALGYDIERLPRDHPRRRAGDRVRVHVRQDLPPRHALRRPGPLPARRPDTVQHARTDDEPSRTPLRAHRLRVPRHDAHHGRRVRPPGHPRPHRPRPRRDGRDQRLRPHRGRLRRLPRAGPASTR
jgi:hypothetical protein